MLAFQSHIGTIFDTAFSAGTIAAFPVPGGAVHAVTQNGGFFVIDVESKAQGGVCSLGVFAVNEIVEAIDIYLLVQLREFIEGGIQISIRGQQSLVVFKAFQRIEIHRTCLIGTPGTFKSAGVGTGVHGGSNFFTVHGNRGIVFPLSHVAGEGIEECHRLILVRLISEHIAVRHQCLAAVTVIRNHFSLAVLIAFLPAFVAGEIVVHISAGSDAGGISLNRQGHHRANIVHIVQVTIAAAACVAAHSAKEQAHTDGHNQTGGNGRTPFHPSGCPLFRSTDILDIFVPGFADGVE